MNDDYSTTITDYAYANVEKQADQGGAWLVSMYDKDNDFYAAFVSKHAAEKWLIFQLGIGFTRERIRVGFYHYEWADA